MADHDELAARASGDLADAGVVTELRAALAAETLRADREAARANAATTIKDELLARLGHQLRNPLAPILTAMQLMRAKAGDAFVAEREIVERHLGDLIRAVDDLLDVSRAGGEVHVHVKVEIVVPAPANANTSRRILVVDDNVDAADLLVDALVHRGHLAVAAYDGVAALRVQLELRPELAFVDIGLPQMDGYEVARCMVIAARGQPLALVALTGYGQPRDRITALAAGFVEHLVKPLSLATMTAVIERLLPGDAALAAATATAAATAAIAS